MSGEGKTESVGNNPGVKDTCAQCRFFQPDCVPQVPGQCRRHSPAVLSLRAWPLVYQDDWCGEWRAKRIGA